MEIIKKRIMRFNISRSRLWIRRLAIAAILSYAIFCMSKKAIAQPLSTQEYFFLLSAKIMKRSKLAVIPPDKILTYINSIHPSAKMPILTDGLNLFEIMKIASISSLIIGSGIYAAAVFIDETK